MADHLDPHAAAPGCPRRLRHHVLVVRATPRRTSIAGVRATPRRTSIAGTVRAAAHISERAARVHRDGGVAHVANLGVTPLRYAVRCSCTFFEVVAASEGEPIAEGKEGRSHTIVITPNERAIQAHLPFLLKARFIESMLGQDYEFFEAHGAGVLLFVTAARRPGGLSARGAEQYARSDDGASGGGRKLK